MGSPISVPSVKINRDRWVNASLSGRAFVLTTDVISISGTTESDFLYVKNPSGSGKSARLWEIVYSVGVGVGTQRSTARAYRGPTVTSNGTPVSIINTNSDIQNDSVLRAYTNPTVSNRGSLIQSIQLVNGNYDRMLWMARMINEGASVLFTFKPSGTNIDHSVFMSWAEEPNP